MIVLDYLGSGLHSMYVFSGSIGNAQKNPRFCTVVRSAVITV